MSKTGLPTDLIDALQALQALAEQTDPPPEPFERVARWRRACGDAEAAATWQTWSLLPPEPEELLSALAGLWRSVGDTDAAACVLAVAGGTKTQTSWQQLALLLEQADLEAASNLQQQLLLDPPVLAIPELLDLLRLWQQQQQPQQALDLLRPLLKFMQKRGEQPSGSICNAMADLLEQLKCFDDAEPWWQRSHALQPQQAWPLMRLGHQSLRRQQPAVALHYARQVLERDPEHEFAPRLQRKALNVLGATRSLQLLDRQEPAELGALQEPPGTKIWEGCRRLALIGFRNASILEGWCQQLKAQGLDCAETIQTKTSQTPIQLWLIASPDPLWLEHQARLLCQDLSHPLNITSWPQWEPQRHGPMDRVMEASENAPFWHEVQP